MNIFILDTDPVKCAEFHCDKHVIKMLLESCQIMCTVLHELGADPTQIPYKSTHKHHPCVLWAKQSSENYIWLWTLTYHLSKEYTKRYNKVHACDKHITSLLALCDTVTFMSHALTPFVLAMPESCKTPDAVLSYRIYYLQEKKKFAKWKLNNTPYWWK